MTKVVLFFQAATLRSKSWRDKLAGIYRYAEKSKWQVQMVQSGASSEEIRYMLDIWKPIGCIVDRSLSCARNPTKLFGRTPVVLMDQNPETSSRQYACVNHDSAATATLAAEELLRTGVDCFSYVPHGLKTHWNRERERALAACIRKNRKHFVAWGETPFSGGKSAARQDDLVARRLRELPKPCGLLCANDQVAQRVMRIAAEAGLSLPKDLTIIGIDNDEFICENTTPTLSSVLPDFQKGGYLAAELLDSVIAHPRAKPVTKHYGPLELVRRNSTRRFATEDTLVNRALELIAASAFDPDFHTESLLRELNCSRSLLEMRFRATRGRSIRDEIQKLRFDKALSLLRRPNQAIAPIANLCGYASEPFFKRLFKKKAGLTMREWRKRNVTRS